jgi:hypothetical protein
VHVKAETNGRPEEKANEIFYVILPYAIVHPGTVMIEFGYATVAVTAVLGA